MRDKILLGRWSEEKIEDLLRRAPSASGERIAFISRAFLFHPYKEASLSPPGEEEFVVDFEGFDCFTYLDTVEALRLSGNFVEFRQNLLRVRYKDGRLSYESRNHFFTDWISNNRRSLFDATTLIGGSHALTVEKMLNIKDDGSPILEGLLPFVRQVTYIPTPLLPSCMQALRTGDYIGVYTSKAGLDCCHVGICIKEDDRLSLRHASSRAGKVVEEDFRTYMTDKEGIIVLRAKDLSFVLSS